MFKISSALYDTSEVSLHERRDLAVREATRGPNVDRCCVLSGALDRARLQRALQQLARRHEGLRTRFVRGPNGEFFRKIEPTLDIPLISVDLTPYSATDEIVREQIKAAAAQGFGPEEYPLIRVTCFSTAANETVFILSVADLIADGKAAAILNKELSDLYESSMNDSEPRLPIIEVTLSQFVASQNAWMKTAQYRERVDLLIAKLRQQVENSGGIEQLFFRPKSKESFLIERQFPAEVADEVYKIAALMRVSVPTVVVALTGICIARARDSEGLFFTSTFSNRHVPGTANLVGHLATTIPSYLSVERQHSASECVQKLHRDLFLSMSQYSMIPISEFTSGFAQYYPELPAGVSIKFGKVVMDVVQDEFHQLFGLKSRPDVAAVPRGIGALYKFVFQAAHAGRLRLWLRGMQDAENERTARQIVDHSFQHALESIRL